jgi:hypothetical protein
VRYTGVVVFLRHIAGLLVGGTVFFGAEAGALSSMSETYTIYGLIDPRTSEVYYVGQTRRKLIERTDTSIFSRMLTRWSPSATGRCSSWGWCRASSSSARRRTPVPPFMPSSTGFTR